MSEQFPRSGRVPNPDDLEAIRSVPSTETVQFSDGSTSVLYRHEGQSINWATHKHAKPSRFNNCVILTMQDKTSLAVGTGVVLILPEFDESKGVYVSDGNPLRSIELEQVAPDGIPVATVGERWMWDSHGPIESMLMRYKFYPPGSAEIQVATPSPTEAAMRVLQFEAGKMFEDYWMMVPGTGHPQQPL